MDGQDKTYAENVYATLKSNLSPSDFSYADDEAGFYKRLETDSAYADGVYKTLKGNLSKDKFSFMDNPTGFFDAIGFKKKADTSASSNGGTVGQSAAPSTTNGSIMADGSTPQPIENLQTLNSIYSKYPKLKNLGEVTLKADPNFTREKTGLGDIEYFSPDQDVITYPNGLKQPHPKKGTHGIVYNPADNGEDAIMLDMLHGMKDADPKYKSIREKFKAQAIKDRGNDINFFYEKDKKAGKAQDGKEQWIENYVDGLVRSEVSPDTTGDYAEERKGNSPAMKKIASELKGYLQTQDVKAPSPTDGTPLEFQWSGGKPVQTVKTQATAALPQMTAKEEAGVPAHLKKMEAIQNAFKEKVRKQNEGKDAAIDAAFSTPQQLVMGFVQGVTPAVSEASRSIAIMANQLDDAENNFFNDGNDKKVTDYATYKFAEAVEQFSNDLPINSNLRQSLVGQLATGAGNLAGFAGAGAAGKTMEGLSVFGKFTPEIVTGLSGAMQQGGSEYKAAYDKINDAKELTNGQYIEKYQQTPGNENALLQEKADLATHDAENDAFGVYLVNAAIGTSDALPISKWLGRLEKATGGLISKNVKKVALNGAVEGALEEGVQESFQQLGTNLTAQQTYDKTREIMDGVLESGTIGGILGATLNGLTLMNVANQPNVKTAADKDVDAATKAYLAKVNDLLKKTAEDDIVAGNLNNEEVIDLEKKKAAVEQDMTNPDVAPEVQNELFKQSQELQKQIDETKAASVKSDQEQLVSDYNEAEAAKLDEMAKDEKLSPETKKAIKEKAKELRKKVIKPTSEAEPLTSERAETVVEAPTSEKPMTDEEVNAAADELKVSEEDTGERSGEEPLPEKTEGAPVIGDLYNYPNRPDEDFELIADGKTFVTLKDTKTGKQFNVSDSVFADLVNKKTGKAKWQLDESAKPSAENEGTTSNTEQNEKGNIEAAPEKGVLKTESSEEPVSSEGEKPLDKLDYNRLSINEQIEKFDLDNKLTAHPSFETLKSLVDKATPKGIVHENPNEYLSFHTDKPSNSVIQKLQDKIAKDLDFSFYQGTYKGRTIDITHEQYLSHLKSVENKSKQREQVLSDLEAALKRTSENGDTEANKSLQEKYDAIKAGSDFTLTDVTKDLIRGVGAQFGELQHREAMKDNYQRQLEKWEKNPTEATKKKILELEKELGYGTSYFDLNKPESDIKKIVEQSGAPKGNVIVGSVPKAEPPPKKKVIDGDEELKNLFNEFREEGGFNTNIFIGATNPKLIAVIYKIMKRFVELGIHKLADIAKAIHEQFGEKFLREAWEYIQNAYLSAWKDADDNIADLMNDPREVKKFDLEKLINELKEEESKAAEEAKKTPENFVAKIKEDIAAGKVHDKRSLEKLGNEYGLTDATKIKELAELAVVELGREIAAQPKVPEQEKYEQLINLYNNQPNLTHRSSESVEKQQYSTPVPYAYMAGVFVGLDKGATGFESSAGNGMLTVAAPDPSKVVVNEIDPTRIENLEKQGYAGVLTQDATLPFSDLAKRFQSGLSNPPFGTLDKPVVKDGFEIRKLEHLILINDLDTMKDDAKGAFIVGGHNQFDEKGRLTTDRTFYNWLYKHYNVKDVINVNGELYKKQGTSFPTRLILIDGRKSVPEGQPPVQTKENNVPVKTWDELYTAVKRSQNSVSYENILQPGMDAGRKPGGDILGTSPGTEISGRPNPLPPAKGGNVGGAINPGERGTGGNDTGLSGQQPGVGDNRPETNIGDSNGERPDVSGNKPTEEQGGRKPETTKGTERTGSKNTERGNNILENARKLAGEAVGAVDAEKVKYVPFSKNYSVETVMPQSMVYQTARTLHKIESEHGDVDQWVSDELGYKDQAELFTKLSGEQIDGVAIALNQIKKGQSSIIGDQTGVGKGRIAAAVIRYAVKNGEKVVFITKKNDLFSDMYRDLTAIGSGDLKPFIVNSGDQANVVAKDPATGQLATLHKAGTNKSKEGVFATGTPPKGTDFVMATYSQFSAAEEDKKGNPLPLSPKKSFLETYGNDAVIIMDESHSAGGESNTGMYFQRIISQAKGLTFLSATFAKRPENMPIYVIKSVMREAGLSNKLLVSVIQKGGVALQEIVANELVSSGQMIRRERTFEGIDFNYHELTHLEKEHAASADKINNIAREIIKFQRTFVEGAVDAMDTEAFESGGGKAAQTASQNDAGINNTPFASKIFNLIDQFLFSVKADAVADQAIEMLKNNEKPLISFKSTMGAFIADMELKPGDVLHTPDFSASLIKGLQNTLRYVETYPNGDSEVKTIPLESLGPEAVAAYQSIVKLINEASTGISISPIDIIINKLEAAGYTVGEVTGRSLQFKPQEDGTLIAVKKTDTDFKKIFNGFNNINEQTGKPDYDVIMFNESGSTGVSAHASVDFTDQRVRHMIIHQVHLNIDTLMQALGRILRTGQVVNPRYTFTSSAIPAEMRLMMMMMKKLKSLSANTTSSQKSNDEIFSQDDFINQYGDDIVLQLLADSPEFNEMLMDPLGIQYNSPEEIAAMTAPEHAASKVTGKVAIMPVKVQKEFYKEVMDRYKDYVAYLKSTDNYMLEAESLPLEAETLSSHVAVQGQGGESAFGNDSVLEKAEVNILKKPYTKAQIELQLKEQLDGETPEQQQSRITEEVISAVQDRYEENVAAVNKTFEDKAKKVEEAFASGKKDWSEEEREAFHALMINDKGRKLDGMLFHHEANISYLRSILNEFRPGKIVMVPLSEKNLMLGAAPGVVIGFHINKKSSNPYTPSAIKLKIAVGDSRQSMAIPLSRHVMVRGIISDTYINNTSQSLLEHWDSSRPQKSRGIRYIVTGNVLAAMGETQFDGGKLISYTKKDGTPQKGILLPEHYANNVDTANPGVKRPLIAMLQKIKDFQSGDFLETTNRELRVSLDPKTGLYKIEVPRSKKKGGEFYLNSDIRDLVESRNFDSYGPNMVAYVQKTNITKFVETVNRLFGYSVNTTNEKSVDQQIRDQQQRVRDAENDNTDGGAPVAMNPIPTKKQAKLLYEYGKLAWLYLKKGMNSLADFLRQTGEKFSEYAVKAWNKAKEEFETTKIVKRLDDMKISTDKTFGLVPPFNLFPAIWNGSIDVIKNKILASARTKADIEKAVQEGLDHAKAELAANGVTMTVDEEKAFKNRTKSTFLRMATTPSFGQPLNPATQAEIDLADQMFEQALNPEVKTPGKLKAVKDFFVNLSKHIDNPFIYVTNIENGILKQYPGTQRQSKVPIGRLFEQSFTGPAKLAVERFRDEVLKGLSATELEAFNKYLLARRVIDRLSTDPQSRATGNLDIDKALKTLGKMEKVLGASSYAKLVERGEKFQQHMDEVLLELVDGQIISQETYDKIKETNEFYAPFNVVQTVFTELGKEIENKGGGTTVLFKIKGIPQERAKLTINDLQKLQKGVADKVITADEFYRGALEILDELLKSKKITEDAYMQEVSRLANPGFGLGNIIDKAAEIIYKSRVIAERNKIFLKLDQMREVDTDQHFFKNVDAHELRYDADGNAYMVPKQLNQIKAPEGFAVIKYKKDGKTTFVAVNEEAAKAMRGLNEFEMTGVMHLMNLANKVARYGIITYSASFLYANSFIDNYRALTMSKYGALAGKNMLDVALNTLILVPQMTEAIVSGLAANLTGRRTPLYEDWMKSKSFKKGIFDDIFENPNHKITAEINKTPGDKALAVLKYILTLIPRVGTALEQMPKLYIHARGTDIEGTSRVGLTEFIKGKLNAAQGLQGPALGSALDEIAYDVLNKAGSPNFSATGNWAKYMSGLFQFFGARLKGEMSDWRILLNREGGELTGKDKAANLARGLFKVGMYAILPMVITAIKNMWDDDDEKSFNTTSQYDRNNNILIKTGATFQHEGQTYNDYFKLPVRGVPATANTLVNSWINYQKHQDPKALRNIGMQLYTNATPLNLNFDFEEDEPTTEKSRKVIQSIVSNMNPLIKYGYEELNNVNTFNDYSLVNMKGYHANEYYRYLQGDKDVMPWDVKPFFPNKKAEDVSKFLYNQLGWKVTEAGVDHLMKVPFGNILNALDTNALSKRMFRSEEQNPVKKKY